MAELVAQQDDRIAPTSIEYGKNSNSNQVMLLATTGFSLFNIFSSLQGGIGSYDKCSLSSGWFLPIFIFFAPPPPLHEKSVLKLPCVELVGIVLAF